MSTTRAPKPKTSNTTAAADPAAASQARLAEALETLNRRQDTLQAHAAALDELEARHRAGDESVTRQALTDTRADVEHWSTLLAAADADVKLAERKIVHTDTSLADLLAPALAEALGITVTTSWERAKGTPPDVPSLVLVQSKPAAKSPQTGALAGRVTAYYARGPLHRQVTGRELADLLNASPAFTVTAPVTCGTTGSSGAVEVDEIELNVLRAELAGTPELEVDPRLVLAGAGRPILDALREVTSYLGEAPRTPWTTSTGMSERPGFVGGFHDVVVKSDEVSRGERRLTLALPFELKPEGSFQSAASLVEHLGEVVEAEVGTILPSLGRITEASVQEVRYPDSHPGSTDKAVRGLVRLVCTSRAAG